MAENAEQKWSSETYDENVRFVSDLGADVLSLLDPRAGERILDLGCGDGALTEKLVAAGADVVGVDSSPEFVAAACERGLNVRLADGHALDFDQEFDAVFSNAALHWMTRPGDVADGVRRALVPGGRFVAEFGGFGNVAAIITAMLAVARMRGGDDALAHVWYFPTPDEYAHVLTANGFEVDDIALIPRPTPLPTGIRGWLGVFREPFFAQFGADRDAALDDAVALLAPNLCDSSGNWIADYVRLRVRARKKV